MNILSITNNFKIIDEIDITYEDGTGTIVSIQEGDLINVSYVEDSVLISIQCKIVNIDMDGCSLVLDNSDKYSSKVIKIQIDKIRAISKIVDTTPIV